MYQLGSHALTWYTCTNYWYTCTNLVHMY